MAMVVLIAESEAIVGVMLELELRHGGCQVFGPVTTAQEALLLARAARIDFALLDTNLHDGNAFELARILLEECAIPSWIFSHDPKEAYRWRDTVFGCIEKPCDMPSILLALQLSKLIRAGHPRPSWEELPGGVELFWHATHRYQPHGEPPASTSYARQIIGAQLTRRDPIDAAG